MLQRVQTASHRFARWLAVYVSGGATILVMILMVSDATTRTLLNRTILGMIDVINILLAWIACAGLAYALVTGVHVRVVLFLSRLSPSARLRFEISNELIGATFFTFFAVILWPYFWESMMVGEIPMAPVPTPVWVAKLALPVGMSAIAVEFWLRLMQKLFALKIRSGEDSKG